MFLFRGLNPSEFFLGFLVDQISPHVVYLFSRVQSAQSHDVGGIM